MNDQNKSITPMKFLPDVQEMPWGTLEYKLADLGFVDSMACEGWLKGNGLRVVRDAVPRAGETFKRERTYLSACESG